MWWMGLTQATLAGVEGGASYAAANAQTKAAKKWQAFRNAMAGYAAGQQINDVVTNTTLATVASGDAAVQIQKNEEQALGSARVAAATAGVKGGSVDATMRDIQRNAANKEDERIQALNQVYMAADEQSHDILVNKNLSMDYSKIGSSNSLLNTVLGVGTKDMKIVGKYQDNGYLDELGKQISGLWSR